eukprot:372881-Prorocentrum_minimum.AAC.1
MGVSDGKGIRTVRAFATQADFWSDKNLRMFKGSERPIKIDRPDRGAREATHLGFRGDPLLTPSRPPPDPLLTPLDPPSRPVSAGPADRDARHHNDESLQRERVLVCSICVHRRGGGLLPYHARGRELHRVLGPPPPGAGSSTPPRRPGTLNRGSYDTKGESSATHAGSVFFDSTAAWVDASHVTRQLVALGDTEIYGARKELVRETNSRVIRWLDKALM